MPPIPSPDPDHEGGVTYRLTLIGAVANQACHNVLHYRKDSEVAPNPELDPGVISESWKTVCLGPWLDVHGSGYELRRIEAVRIYPDLTTIYLDSASLPAVGTVAGGETTSPSTALVLTLRSQKPGRRCRGRLYLGGLPEENEEDGLWVGNVWQTAVDALIGALMTPLPGSVGGPPAELVIYSRSANPQLGPYQPSATNCLSYVSQITTDYIVRGLRRRQVGRGI